MTEPCENQASPTEIVPVQMTEVTFVPQAWLSDYAVVVDPEGPTTWLVETEKLKGLEPDQHDSDNLRFHDNAPAWVRDWSGPFYTTWDDFND